MPRNHAKSPVPLAASKEYLNKDPLGPLMFKLALPTIVSQLAGLLYNIVDRILIAHLPGTGTDALTGLGICIPIATILIAFAYFSTAGGSPLASMELGAKRPDKAREIMLTAQTMLFIAAVLLMVVTYAFMPQILLLFGASESTLPYAQTYLSIYLLGTFFVMVAFGMSLFLLAQGENLAVMIANGSGALIHVILALIFIYVCGWGIEGAATATVISQGISAALVVYYLNRPRSVLHFEPRLIRLRADLVLKIISVGSGRFFIMVTEGLLLIAINSTLQAYGGDTYVAVITVLVGIQNIAMAPIQGFTQGVQPVISYCYGAKNTPRVKKTIRYTVMVSFALSLLLVGLIVLFPQVYVGVFTDDTAVADIAVSNIPLFFAGLLFFGIQMALQTGFMGLGKGLCSLSVAAVRKVVLFIPLVFILPNFFGAWGVFLAEPVSDLLSVTFCITLFLLVVPKMLRE